MVDDRIDGDARDRHSRGESSLFRSGSDGGCPDYWYVNEKIARSPPSIHVNAARWGDIRGMCIYGKEKNRLYLNRGAKPGQRFVDVADQVGMSVETNSRGMSAVDLDNDGRLDLVVTHQFEPATLYRNASGKSSAGNWIGFELEGDGRTCNRAAVGSTIQLVTRDDQGRELRQMREIQVADGFSAQNDPRAHFGLGGHAAPIDIEVSWCGSALRLYERLAVNRYHAIRMRSAP